MHISNDSSLGQRLRQERERLQWSQERLAEAIGATSMSIYRWEHEKAVPQAHYRERLCQVFNTSADTLFATSIGEKNETYAQPLCWHVPYLRNPFFTGRVQALERLHTALNGGKGEDGVQVQAVGGLGGIGKTQLALEYIYRFRDDYQTVLWVRAESQDLLLSDLAALASVLDIQTPKTQDLRQTVEAVRRWLSEHSGWLLMLDNIEELTILSEVIPAKGHGHIVLTTRRQATGTLAHFFELEPMQSEEGALFLLRRAKRLPPHASLEEAEAETRIAAITLCQILDGLPLALDQAGAYLEETGCRLSDYVNAYHGRCGVLLKRRGSIAIDHPASVAATLSLCIQQVAKLNPGAADLLHLCAFLHPDAIPVELLIEGADGMGLQLQPMVTDPLQFDAILVVLRTYSMVRRHPETNTLSIHRLVQAVLKEELDISTRRTWATRAVRVVNRAFPEVEEGQNWSRCLQYLPQALTCASLITAEDLTFPEAAHLLQQSGAYLIRRGQYVQAREFLDQARAIYECIVGSEHPEIATTLNFLAEVSYYQGNYSQAETLFLHSLAMREKLLGPEHLDVATLLNNLAYFYERQGNYAQAEAFCQRALAIREQALRPGHSDVAICLNHLALIYKAQGNYVQAETLFRRALAMQEQALGSEHPYVANSLNNLGTLYNVQKRYTQAEPLFLRALSIQRQELGPEHPYVATTLHNLAVLYQARGSYAQAESLFQETLAIEERLLGSVHPSIATTLHNLGVLYQVRGSYARAESLLQRALSIREQSLGRTHPQVAESSFQLAILLQDQGKYAQAELLYQQALTIWETSLEPMHPKVRACVERFTELRNRQTERSRAACEEDGVEYKGFVDPSPVESEQGPSIDSLQSNPLADFLSANCERHPRAWSRADDLWTAYQEWTRAQGERFPLTRRQFTRALKAQGCTAGRTKTSRIWRGVALCRFSSNG